MQIARGVLHDGGLLLPGPTLTSWFMSKQPLRIPRACRYPYLGRYNAPGLG